MFRVLFCYDCCGCLDHFGSSICENQKDESPELDVNLNPRQSQTLNNLILSPFRKGVKRNGQNCPSGASYRVSDGIVFFVIDARKTVLFQYQQRKHAGSSYVILR